MPEICFAAAFGEPPMTVTHDPYVLGDVQWARLATLMPRECEGKRGPRTENRLFLDAVLWTTWAGERWKDLPERSGKGRDGQALTPPHSGLELALR